MLQEVSKNLIENGNFFRELVISHLKITIITVLIAVIIGLLLGILIAEHRKFASLTITFVNTVYTIPSIALLGILITITGIGNLTAIIALTIYGLLPVVRSTYTGIVNIDEKIIEAGEAMGSTRLQILYKIKLPLALPVIFSGIRNMVTMTVALAGIASFVGAGGLGVAIYRGITTNNRALILNGSILVALLAVLFDIFLGMAEKRIGSRKKKEKKNLVFSVLAAGLIVVGLIAIGKEGERKEIKLASKPTTEGYLLGELVKQMIETKCDLKVKMTHGVGGGTANLHPATERGDFDLYPEYTGTAWQVVLKEKGLYTEDLFPELQKKYEENYDFLWMGMFGFNNTYSLGIRTELAEKYGIKTFSDLAKLSENFVFGAEYDFFEREDGFKALAEAYSLKFKKTVDMDNGLKYQAILNGKIDVMTVFTTDGQLSDKRITVLSDDKSFYPSYQAGVVLRREIIERYPELKAAMEALISILNEKTMAELNYKVEIGGEKPENVIHTFLKEKDLVGR